MTDLEFIKKYYGEKFSHFCRDNFSTILETPGVLSKIIFDHFAPTHSLYNDLIEPYRVKTPEKNVFLTDDQNFISFIYAIASSNKKDHFIKTNKTPEQLFDEAGYILYPECETNEDILKFKKYYEKDESLCTFNSERLKIARVWFAVKKNVENIKRENFTNPQREDEYGTSVLSIQFSRGSKSLISIKNRYNHHVKNPDCTFLNNLDNIKKGLTYAFTKKFNISLVNNYGVKFRNRNYILANDAKFYRFNIESDANYFCENNVFLFNNNPIHLNPSRYLILDNFILDKQKCKFVSVKKETQDDFVRTIGEIKKVSVVGGKNQTKLVTITPIKGKDIYIVLNKFGGITKYINYNVTEIRNNFMHFNNSLECLILPNVRIIGDNFLEYNETLERLYLPKTISIGDYFMYAGYALKFLLIPNNVTMGKHSIYLSEDVKHVDAKNLKYIDYTDNTPAPILDYIDNEEIKNSNSPICL